MFFCPFCFHYSKCIWKLRTGASWALKSPKSSINDEKSRHWIIYFSSNFCKIFLNLEKKDLKKSNLCYWKCRRIKFYARDKRPSRPPPWYGTGWNDHQITSHWRRKRGRRPWLQTILDWAEHVCTPHSFWLASNVKLITYDCQMRSLLN